MFAIKLLGLAHDAPNSPNYQMISCDNFTVTYPDKEAKTGTSDDAFPMIGVWVKNGDVLNFEGYPVRNVAYVINGNGKTVDTIRP